MADLRVPWMRHRSRTLEKGVCVEPRNQRFEQDHRRRHCWSNRREIVARRLSTARQQWLAMVVL